MTSLSSILGGKKGGLGGKGTLISNGELGDENGVNLNSEITHHCGVLVRSALLRQSPPRTSDRGPQKHFWQ